MARISAGDSTTQHRLGSLDLFSQIEQSSCSVRFLHSRQFPTLFKAETNDSLSFNPPALFLSKRNKVILCADLGPTPGRHLKDSISWLISGLEFIMIRMGI